VGAGTSTIVSLKTTPDNIECLPIVLLEVLKTKFDLCYMETFRCIKATVSLVAMKIIGNHFRRALLSDDS